MQKVIITFLMILCIPWAHSSKLSKFVHEQEERQRAEQQREWDQDMNFADLSFRLERRYINERHQPCRDYSFRARSNPYRHGHYKVCADVQGPRAIIERGQTRHHH